MMMMFAGPAVLLPVHVALPRLPRAGCRGRQGGGPGQGQDRPGPDAAACPGHRGHHHRHHPAAAG